MKLSSLLRSFLTLSAFAALAFWPQAALAQHGGGHGGGGGFHGGGGGGFHGGGGGYHGGGYSGGHSSYSTSRAYGGYHGGGYGHGGGYYGHGYGYGHGWYGHGWYGGRYWGYPYYGWGWGWGFGWGWPYYSGWGYPYGYWGYPNYYYSYPSSPSSDDPNTDPNNYPYQCPPGYSCIQDPRGNPPQGQAPPANNTPRYAPPSGYEQGNPQPWRAPSTAPSPAQLNPGANQLAPSRDTYNMMPGRVLSVDRIPEATIVATPAAYRTTPTGKPVVGPMRPEVLRAMQHLHEMPPSAREREIATGRYSQFSAEEKQLLRSVR